MRVEPDNESFFVEELSVSLRGVYDDLRSVFILEWSIEDRLDYLEEYYKRGAMIQEQVARYEELKKLVVRNRPIVECLANR